MPVDSLGDAARARVIFDRMSRHDGARILPIGGGPARTGVGVGLHALTAEWRRQGETDALSWALARLGPQGDRSGLAR